MKDYFFEYLGQQYDQGDTVVISLFTGHGGQPISREDNGRVILIEEGNQLDVKPGDRVKCVIVTIASRDLDGKRSGFSIVRPLEILGRVSETTATTVKNEEEEGSTESRTVMLESDLRLMLTRFNPESYPILATMNGIVNVNDTTQNVSWSQRFLIKSNRGVIEKWSGRFVLVSIIDRETGYDIISPFRARISDGHITIPRALRHVAVSYRGEPVGIRLRELPIDEW